VPISGFHRFIRSTVRLNGSDALSRERCSRPRLVSGVLPIKVRLGRIDCHDRTAFVLLSGAQRGNAFGKCKIGCHIRTGSQSAAIDQ
jgi:hypothetical protein